MDDIRNGKVTFKRFKSGLVIIPREMPEIMNRLVVEVKDGRITDPRLNHWIDKCFDGKERHAFVQIKGDYYQASAIKLDHDTLQEG